jgi:hypothetical protein
VVTLTTAAADHRADVAVDGLHLAERDRDTTVGEDAVEVTAEELGDLVEGREPLPAQRPDPGGQEAPRRSLVGIVPEARQLLLEQMGFGEPTVEGEKFLEFLPLTPLDGPRRGATATACPARGRGRRRPDGRIQPAEFRRARRSRGAARGTCHTRSARGAGASAGSP